MARMAKMPAAVGGGDVGTRHNIAHRPCGISIIMRRKKNKVHIRHCLSWYAMQHQAYIIIARNQCGKHAYIEKKSPMEASGGQACARTRIRKIISMAETTARKALGQRKSKPRKAPFMTCSGEHCSEVGDACFRCTLQQRSKSKK